jgi:hypothetical protein
MGVNRAPIHRFDGADQFARRAQILELRHQSLHDVAMQPDKRRCEFIGMKLFPGAQEISVFGAHLVFLRFAPTLHGIALLFAVNRAISMASAR